jgi:cell division protein ZapA (FtsZ GTPase activity inhibitor)
VEKTSVRLPPEISKKLQAEARKIGDATGKAVTVSDVIRACIGEKFPEISSRSRRESAAILVLQDEVARLSERCAGLSQDLEKLVQTLSDIVPQLATREQVDGLTDAIAAVIRATKERP